MRSVVNFAVLTLVLEKPSYGNEIGRRFEDRYGGLFGSRAHHAHRSLRALEKKGLVERYRTTRGSNRQPRPHFQITEAGRDELRVWLRSPLPPGSVDQEMAVRLLSVQDGDRETMERLLELYRSAMIAAATQQPLVEDCGDPNGIWFRELERFEKSAAIEWSDWARRQLGEAATT